MPAKKREVYGFERDLAADSPESALWFAWKRAHEVVRAAVLDDVTTATGLSDPDSGILLRIDGSGGTLRQNQLAAMLGWDRTRLSHQLSRMEERGLVRRRRVGGGVAVDITEDGQNLVGQARPLHADAVRRHLIEPLGADGYATLEDLLRRLTGDH